MARTTDPPVSQAQRKAMGAAMSGHSNIGIPKSVGKEFIEADPGGKLPEKSKDRSKTMNNDVENPKPSSGPMSTEGPGTSKSEGLPEAASAKESMRDSGPDCGKEMSLDSIKAMGKRIGRY